MERGITFVEASNFTLFLPYAYFLFLVIQFSVILLIQPSIFRSSSKIIKKHARQQKIVKLQVIYDRQEICWAAQNSKAKAWYHELHEFTDNLISDYDLSNYDYEGKRPKDINKRNEKWVIIRTSRLVIILCTHANHKKRSYKSLVKRIQDSLLY